MPKARKRTGRSQATARRANESAMDTMNRPLQKHSNTKAQARAGNATAPSQETVSAPQVYRPFISPVVRGPQSLIMPGMVALGCWLMAFTMFFLSTDPNRNLFGGIAVLMALMWTYSFGTRTRKLLSLQRKA